MIVFPMFSYDSLRNDRPCAEIKTNVTVSGGKHQKAWDYTIEPRQDKTNNMTVRPAKTQITLSLRYGLSW